jgi:hypothetical protein
MEQLSGGGTPCDVLWPPSRTQTGIEGLDDRVMLHRTQSRHVKRWYVAYLLSYRQVEELMQERSVSIDHATINRWVLKYSLQLEEAFHRRKWPV